MDLFPHFPRPQSRSSYHSGRGKKEGKKRAKVQLGQFLSPPSVLATASHHSLLLYVQVFYPDPMLFSLPLASSLLYRQLTQLQCFILLIFVAMSEASQVSHPISKNSISTGFLPTFIIFGSFGQVLVGPAVEFYRPQKIEEAEVLKFSM